MEIELNRKLKGAGNLWNINGKTIKLCCKEKNDVEYLLTATKEYLERKDKLYPLTLKYSAKYVLLVIAVFFPRLGKEYLEHHVYTITKETGEFFKNDFLFILLNNGIRFDLQTIQKNNEIMDFLNCYEELVRKANLEIFNIRGHLEKKITFVDLLGKISPGRIIRYCYHDYHDLFVDYFEYFCCQFTLNYQVVYMWSVLHVIFGREYSVSQGMKTENERDVEKIFEELHQIVNKEYEYQCKYFPSTNNKRLNMNHDSWVMFFLRGTALKGREINFSNIESTTLKKEIKLWFKYDLLLDKTYFEGINSNVNMLSICLNSLTNSNPTLHHFADIETADVITLLDFLENEAETYKQDKVAVHTIAIIFSNFKTIINFLMDYADDEKEKGRKVFYPIPKTNPFNDVIFNNLDNMRNPTELIPDIVMEQLRLHLNELKQEYVTTFEIFDGTGMRAKEVLLLEHDCINDTNNELYFIQYKNLSVKRRKARPDRKLLIISNEVKKLIKEQIDKTVELRLKYNIPYIFINKSETISRSMPSSAGFVYIINKLIQKYDIRDYDGTLWYFSCRQMRKKVAERLVINNATPFEVMYQLGHEYPSTARKFYEEVEKRKMADMEDDYYEEQFGIKLGKENLEKFTEEERRALYVDFKLNYREVEFGKCIKHFSEKACGKMTGRVSCTHCPKCATGKKYLPKWIELRDSQKKRIDDLIKSYQRENIIGYESFVEFKREMYDLQCYEDTINKILNN